MCVCVCVLQGVCALVAVRESVCGVSGSVCVRVRVCVQCRGASVGGVSVSGGRGSCGGKWGAFQSRCNKVLEKSHKTSHVTYE